MTSSSESESTNPKNFTVPSCLQKISSRNFCFSPDWNPLFPSSLFMLSLKWIKHLTKVAKWKFLLKPSINAFSLYVPHTKIPSRNGLSDLIRWANLEYVFQSLRWCISNGPINTWGSPVCLFSSLRFLCVVTVRLSENVASWVNSRYTEFFWTGAKLHKPLELTIICQNNEEIWVYCTFSNEDAFFGDLLLSLCLFQEGPHAVQAKGITSLFLGVFIFAFISLVFQFFGRVSCIVYVFWPPGELS